MRKELSSEAATTPRQIRPVGWGVRGAGCVTRVAGFFIALGGANHIRAPLSFGESRAEGLVTGILMIVGGIAAVFAGARLSRFGRRHTTRLIRDSSLLESRSYILYLRPFGLDDQLYAVKPDPSRNPVRRLQTPLSRTYEEDLVLSLRFKLGRVVAVGKPGERLPRSGARRFYLPSGDWEPTVSALIDKARLVVLATGTTEGTLWELTEAVRLLPPERLLLIVFTDEADYDRFRQASAACFTARAAESKGAEADRLSGFRLPDYPPLQHPEKLTRVVGTQGFITFGPDWQPEFVRLDPTAVWALSDLGRIRKVVRRQANPALRRVKRGLSQAQDVPHSGVLAPRVPPQGEARDAAAPTSGTE
ncbi:hypothetical protein [Streptomyces sp. NPDC057794]|uniref:hypothetical protein n=1 Tax=Streptomyces sp. NPDC057794 TaxID=3346251 RepID=UPI0036AFF2A3